MVFVVGGSSSHFITILPSSLSISSSLFPICCLPRLFPLGNFSPPSYAVHWLSDCGSLCKASEYQLGSMVFMSFQFGKSLHSRTFSNEWVLCRCLCHCGWQENIITRHNTLYDYVNVSLLTEHRACECRFALIILLQTVVTKFIS